jgi:hypothetical protein
MNEAARRIARTPLDLTRTVDAQARDTYAGRNDLGQQLDAANMPIARALHGETTEGQEFTFVGG